MDLLSNLFRSPIEKHASSFNRVYFYSFIIWNWKLIYFLFFEKTEFSKFYSIGTILPIQTLSIENPAFDAFLSQILNIALVTISPLLLSYLAIKYLPRIQNWVHENDVANYFIREKAYLNEKANSEKSKSQSIEVIAVEKVKQKESEKIIEENLTEDDRIRAEFEELKTNITFSTQFENIIKILYENNGNIYYDNRRLASPEVIALCDTRGLIELNEYSISLTPKGKKIASFFLK